MEYDLKSKGAELKKNNQSNKKAPSISVEGVTESMNTLVINTC